MAKKGNKNIVKQLTEDYANNIDYEIVNDVLETKGVTDFKLSKQILQNIAEWALNADTTNEIRTKLELTPKQWQLLCAICPAIINVMEQGRVLADTIILGSLFQVAIGGQRVPKQLAKTITEYDERGKPCKQHIEIVEIMETLPPNPALLKFLAEKKLNENFGSKPISNPERYRNIVDGLSKEERALIESTRFEDLEGEDDGNA